MKDAAEAKVRLKGLFNITTTPFTADGDFDFPALAENIERVVALGFDGILIGGTYGEFPTMTTQERATLFAKAMDVVGDRVPVMLCSAGSEMRVVRELTTLAGDLGGLPMITPPYVSEVTDGQILGFFREAATFSRTGILIYNAPGVGITLSPGLIEALSDIPSCVGIKQGDLTPTTIDILANRLRGELKLFCASDLAFLGPMMAGFDGLSSTNSSAFPELIQNAFRAVVAGDARTAIALQQAWYPFRELARRFGQPQTTKAAMNARGFRGGRVRAPLTDLTGTERDAVAKVALQLAAHAGSKAARAA